MICISCFYSAQHGAGNPPFKTAQFMVSGTLLCPDCALVAWETLIAPTAAAAISKAVEQKA